MISIKKFTVLPTATVIFTSMVMVAPYFNSTFSNVIPTVVGIWYCSWNGHPSKYDQSQCCQLYDRMCCCSMTTRKKGQVSQKRNRNKIKVGWIDDGNVILSFVGREWIDNNIESWWKLNIHDAYIHEIECNKLCIYFEHSLYAYHSQLRINKKIALTFSHL